jgi:hypothetical protein
MSRPSAFDGMMHEFCAVLGWCGSVKDGKRLHVTDFIPSAGPVSADQFASWIVEAEGLDPNAINASELTRLASVFIKHMGANVIDARSLRFGSA